jgi:ribose 1,5-bisphosphokinase PhnN
VLAKDENKQAIEAYIRPDQPAEVIYALQTSADNADLFWEFPANIDRWKKKGVVVMNISTVGLVNERDQFSKSVVVLELTRNILEHLYGTFNDIMSPVM